MVALLLLLICLFLRVNGNRLFFNGQNILCINKFRQVPGCHKRELGPPTGQGEGAEEAGGEEEEGPGQRHRVQWLRQDDLQPPGGRPQT